MDTSLNFDFVRNDLYCDHKLIMAKMQSRFKNQTFYEEEVMNYCQECEQQIGDIDSMVKFIEIPLIVTDFSKALMPCNVFKIMDVYLQPKDNNSRVNYNRNGDGRYLFFDTDLRLRRVYINYIGTPVNRDGIPLIVRAHEMACLYYSLYNSLMEVASEGKFDMSMWGLFRNETPLRIAEAIGSKRHRDSADMNHLDIIRGNMVPKIGSMSLLNTTFQ